MDDVNHKLEDVKHIMVDVKYYLSSLGLPSNYIIASVGSFCIQHSNYDLKAYLTYLLILKTPAKMWLTPWKVVAWVNS
jgi:hypothetical protein